MRLRIITAVTLVFILVALFIYFTVTTLTKKKKISEHQMFVKYNRRYNFYYDFYLSRKLFRKIYLQVTNLAVYNFREARVQAVKFYERSLIISLSVFVIVCIGFNDLITGVLLLVFSLVMVNNLVAKRINNVCYECLRAISRVCGQLTDSYTRLRSIPDAINQCQPPKILERMMDKIFLIVTANDGRDKLETFFQENQNRQLRTLAVTCYLRADIGEDKEHGSPFKQALRLIKDEVDMEVRRQLNMRLMFRSLEFLPFMALFAYPVVRFILQKLIPATTGVFAGTIGYTCKLILVLVVLICYYTLSTLNNASVARTDDRLDFITELLYRDSVRKFARTLIPKSFQKRRKQQKIIDGCLSSKTLEYVALEKFIFGLGCSIASVLFSIAIIISARSGVYDSLTDSSMTTSLKYTPAQEAAVLEYQHEIMDSGRTPNIDEVEEFFYKHYPKITVIELQAHVERLNSVVTAYRNISFRWWFSFIYIAAWFIGHGLSDLLLKLRSKLVDTEAEIDVLQLQTIIAILMDTPLDTLGVIYWLAKSSDIHKDVLTHCYHEYTRDAFFAIDHLKSKSTIPEFSDMCDKLKTTITQVTLSESFEDLVLDRANTLTIRETVQTAALKSKRSLASPIAKAPMFVWMGLGFILPVVVVALQTAKTTLGGINNLGG